MNLRTKILLPLAVFGAVLAGYLYAYWIPLSLEEHRIEYRDATERHLDSVIEGLIPLILGHQLDTIYENLDALRAKNRDWVRIELVDAGGRSLYPLEGVAAPLARGSGGQVHVLRRQIEYLGSGLGVLTVTIDFAPWLTQMQERQHELAAVVLTVIVAFFLSAGYVLERVVIKPVNALGDAASELARNRFDVALEKSGDDEVGSLVDRFGEMRDAIRGYQTELLQRSEVLKKSEAGLAEAQRMAHLGSWELDCGQNCLVWSDEVYRILGLDPQQGRATFAALRAAVHPADRRRLEAAYTGRERDGVPYDIDYRIVRARGEEIRHLREICEAVRNDAGEIVRFHGTLHDITEMKLAETALARANRALRMLSDSNESLIRLGDEVALLNEVCRIAVDVGGYRMAWVGYAETDAAKTLRPVAHAGFDSGYFDSARFTWAENERGRGPSGTAVRTGTPCMVRDVHTDPSFVPWREEALRRGYQAVFALPLVSEGRSFGVLGIYAAGTDAFDDKETEILHELAGDLSVGIAALRDRVVRQRAEEELRERERHTQSLLRLSRNLERSQTYAEVLNSARDEVGVVIGYRNLWAYLLSDDRKTARVLVAAGPTSDAVMLEEGTAVLSVAGDRMLEAIAAAREIVIVEDARTDGRVNREIVARLGNRTIVNVPIVLFDRHLGSIGTGTFGDEGVRVPSIPEQKYLMALASHMAVALDRIHLMRERESAEMEVRRLNQQLEQRVAERTAQLEAANRELEAFAYSVSHDLRAPLRHIDGFLDMLKKRIAPVLDDQSQRYMATISGAALRMAALIDDLLSFSRMGRKEFAATRFDLGTLVQEVIHDFEPETRDRIVHWRVGGLPEVVGDRAMLRIALFNLISNALKFTRPRTEADIEIGCQAGSDAETIVFVRDNGVGFDMQYIDKLFGVFQRLHGVTEFEGTGIGLANVRRVIERHGGRTWAEGKVEGGATFCFSLPKTPAP